MGTVVGIANTTHDWSAESFSEEKFRLAVEACPSGMVMTDGAGTIVLTNTAIERLFGYPCDELIGQPIEVLITRRLQGEYHKQRAAFAQDPQARRAQPNRELFGLRRDGTEFPIEVWLNPIDAHDGLYVLSVIVDITEPKRMERVKDEFVSTVSHELRTPLTSISGSLGLLLGGAAGTLPEGAVRLLSIAHSNSKRLVRLINDILDIEKIESGQVVFNFKRVDVLALVEQVIEANRAYADGFGVRVRLDPASLHGNVPADPDRLAQVITNLLSNAIKFSPQGGDVIIATELRAALMRISIRDHGSGIPAEFKPRVFEKFAQADATDARQKGGTGLGLSIVREIVVRLGGEVGFADADGDGTVFNVDLPNWAQIAEREIDAERSPDAIRILFCEDDPDAALALREELRPLGFSTDFAHNADDAIARARADFYAAIIVDFELPDADGIGLIRQFRDQPEIYKTPIVVASSDRVGDKEEASKLNIFKWIGKPIDVYKLAQILDNAVSSEVCRRPSILHVDDDPEALDLVALTLEPMASITSVVSIEEARRALLAYQFDLAVLDVAVGPVSGLDLLPELRRHDGSPIPVIIFSGHPPELVPNAQVEARLDKSRASLDDLVTAVHDRLMLRSSYSREEVA
jgi:PAS domain S-box-containing protein